MSQKSQITIPVLRIQQPVGDFFIGVISANDLVAISYADMRTLERDLDDFMGIQRRLSKTRVKEIGNYVETFDATFPTSIILSVEEKNANWDKKANQLTLSSTDSVPFDKIAKILDGQHRVEGLRHYRGDVFELNVSIFVGADIATQANIFATVNLAQTKVNRSLVYDLFDYEKQRSPQKSAHDIAVALDQVEGSPFQERIKRLGSATPGRKLEILTQAAVVESLLQFISTEPAKDRHSFFKKILIRKADKRELQRLIFRNLFLDNKDTEITRIVLNFFKAVRDKWPNAWDDFTRKGNVLPKTNGLKALMRFLRPAYLSIVKGDIGRIVTENEFSEILGRVALKDQDFNIETFPPGTSGEAKLFRLLMNDTIRKIRERRRLSSL